MYIVNVKLTPKQAVDALLKSVKGKKDSEVLCEGEKLVVSYDTETKLYTYAGSQYKSITEVRKLLRDRVRELLGIH